MARELDVSDQKSQVRMLAEVLCHRDLSNIKNSAPADESAAAIPRTPLGIAKALWKLVGLFDAIGDELAKRPHSRAPFRYLGMLPGIGAIAAYLGEHGALTRAAKAGRQWIERHQATPSPPT